MAKQEKQPKPVLHRWRITLIVATPAHFLGYVRAPDEASTIERAAKDFNISNALIYRIVAARED